jgi:biopolymer transport protein ExbD
MAQVKPKRHGPAMDMTAMCDVAFLLLTFFIMTTTFKSQETVKVITPSSVSDLIVEEKNIGTISVTNEGKYFFGITEPVERRAFINVLNTKMNLGLSTDEQNTFTKIAEVGVGKEGLKSYLNLNASDREKVKVPGIACDLAGNLAIRGDVKTQYPAVKVLFDELGKAKIYKFRLVTKGE